LLAEEESGVISGNNEKRTEKNMLYYNLILRNLKYFTNEKILSKFNYVIKLTFKKVRQFFNKMY
jgi:hypothetical protein